MDKPSDHDSSFATAKEAEALRAGGVAKAGARLEGKYPDPHLELLTLYPLIHLLTPDQTLVCQLVFEKQ